MISTQRLARLVVVGILACVYLGVIQNPGLAGDKKKKDENEGKKGTTIGQLTGKGENFIEVKADGEEKGRKYVPQWVGGAPAQGGGPDKTMLKTFRELKIGSRIEVDWLFEERFRAMKVKVLRAPEKDSKETREEKKGAAEERKLPKDVKSAKVVGLLTAKGKNFIEVKADGEEAARKYFLHMGGSKKVLQTIHDTALGSRVQVEWALIEHRRVLDMEVIKGAVKDK